MKVRTIGYFFVQALRSIKRNFWMSTASIITVAVSMIILGAFVLVVANTNHIASEMESDVEIAVFLDVETSSDEVQQVGGEIEGISGVEKTDFIPKEEGLEQLNERFGDSHNLLQALGGENPLPDYYIVKAEEPENVSSIAEEIEGLRFVEKVDYGQGVVEKLFSLTHWIRFGGIIAISLLAAATVFLIAITIRLTIFARKKEINIMKYVGATNWFIRWPFFIEGMFLGVLGSLLACIILYFSYNFMVEKIETVLSFVPLLKNAEVLRYMLFAVFIAGPVIGALGSLFSLRRFLHV